MENKQLVPPFNITENDKRLTTHPIEAHRRGTWNYYNDARRCFWTAQEVNLSNDAIHWETKLTKEEKHFIEYILAFFAASDGIVNINLIERFKEDVPMLEAKYFYNFQAAMEDIHAEMYSLQIDAIMPSKSDREKLLNAIHTFPTIKIMADFMYNCINSNAVFGDRILRMACVEGIFFTGCFCVIYRLQNRGLMPGLGHANELIARDEALHTMFALHIYSQLNIQHKVSNIVIRNIINEAVDIAKKFIADALPVGLVGMNANMMNSYIESQADNIATLIDCPIIYGSKHDFHFMEQINLLNRTNFFERRVSEYSKPQTSETTNFDVNYDI